MEKRANGIVTDQSYKVLKVLFKDFLKLLVNFLCYFIGKFCRNFINFTLRQEPIIIIINRRIVIIDITSHNLIC